MLYSSCKPSFGNLMNSEMGHAVKQGSLSKPFCTPTSNIFVSLQIASIHVFSNFQLLSGISFSWPTYLQPERILDPIASQASMVWDWHRIMTIRSPPHILVLGLGHLWLPMITGVAILCVSFIWHTKWYRSCSETCGVSWGSKIFQSANSQKFTEVKQSHDIPSHATICGQEMPRVWKDKLSLDYLPKWKQLTPAQFSGAYSSLGHRVLWPSQPTGAIHVGLNNKSRQ